MSQHILLRPLSSGGDEIKTQDLLWEILTELRMTNIYLQLITNESITEEDLDEN